MYINAEFVIHEAAAGAVERQDGAHDGGERELARQDAVNLPDES